MSYVDYKKIDKRNIQKNYRVANYEIDKMLKEDPYNYILLSKKIKILIKLGEIEKAEEMIEEKRELIGDQELVLKGKIEKRKGNVKEALIYYKKELEINDNLDACILMGNLLEEYGALDLAKLCYERVKDNPCQLKPALLGISRIAIRQGDNEEAEKSLKILTEKKPNDSEGITSLMVLEMYKENYGKAYDYMCELPIYYLQKKATKAKNEEFFLRYKLGMLTNDELKNYTTYIEKQIINYNEKSFYNENQRIIDNMNANGYHFAIKNINELSETLKETKINLSRKTPINIGFTNQYIVKCPMMIGKSDIAEKETKTLSVITLAGTNNIINVFPVPDYFDEYPYQETENKLERKRSNK